MSIQANMESLVLMPDDLTLLQQAIFDVLRANGSWMTRSEISTGIGRPHRLVPHDLRQLQALVDMQLVELSIRRIGTVKTARIYRAIS